MNDNKSRSYKSILKLFPYLDNKEKLLQLKIDDDSLSYISVRKHADKITEIIKYHLYNLDKCVISDATAGVGGNTISFGINCQKVHAIELDKTRSEYLQNNIDVYNLNNVQIYNDDCTTVLSKIHDHDVIFIDPPWGGSNYKKYELLRLKLSNIPIESICNTLLNHNFMMKTPSLIIFKLPSNYDIRYFKNNVDSNSIYYYDLKKMIVLVVVNDKL
jgi:16S rRNA G966 N2-methylase RsmD